MTKKILSLFCALAILVTMISVAAFSASAEETGNFAGLGDATVAYGDDTYSGQFTSDTYGDVVFPWQTTADVSFDENYNIGDSFSLSFNYANGYHASTAKEFELTFELGDLKVYVYSNGNAPYETYEVYYGDTLLGTDAGTWGHYVTTSSGVVPALYEDMGKAGPNGADPSLYHKVVTCAYENDTITVTIGKEGSTTAIKTITGTVADADFSDAAMTFDIKEDGYRPGMIYNLAGTYAEATTQGGGTPPPPGREGTALNLLGSDVIENWELTRMEGVTGAYIDSAYTGIIDMTKCPTKVEGWTGLLNGGRLWQKHWADFTYGENVNLTDDFELLTTGYMYAQWGGAIGGDPAIGTYYDIALGEYAIRVQMNPSRSTTTDRCKFDIFLLKGGEVIGTSTGTTGDYWVTIGETTSLTGTTLAGGNMRDTIGTALANSTIAQYIVSNSYKYDPKTNTSTVATGNDAGFYAYGGDYCNTAYTDLTIVVKDGKLSVKAVDGTVVEFAKGNDTFTTVDVAEGAFNYISPVVTVYGPDNGMYSGKPIGILRLDATVYGEEPAPLPDPAVVTFNATKGTVGTATATVNEEGKLASLPTPTYTGAGTFTFDGWYTAEVGGTKITTDTVFAEDTTVYAQWTRTLTTTEMGDFDVEKCLIPEDLNWNCSGSGIFETSGHGKGLIIGGSNIDFGLTAEIDTYNINSYFKVDYDIWYKNVGGRAEGCENFILHVGDIAITFTRSPNAEDTPGKHLLLKSVTYKGEEVELVGETEFTVDNIDFYEHNSDFVKTQANDFAAYLEENMIRNSWMFKTDFWSNCNLGVEVVYDAGVITIKNTTGEAVNSVAADLTKVDGFDATKALGESKVSAEIKAIKARGTFVSIMSDFNGVYEKVGAQGGSGSGTGTGTGTGNGGSNAPQTGDNRNVVLPICVALASVAVAGATLIRRKRA